MFWIEDASTRPEDGVMLDEEDWSLIVTVLPSRLLHDNATVPPAVTLYVLSPAGTSNALAEVVLSAAYVAEAAQTERIRDMIVVHHILIELPAWSSGLKLFCEPRMESYGTTSIPRCCCCCCCCLFISRSEGVWNTKMVVAM